MNNDKLKNRIKALLEKTTENGASEAEAMSALQKANELMKDHFIELTDIQGADVTVCISKRIPKFKTAYNFEIFTPALAEMFECQFYWQGKTVTFFGYPEDVELCCYFYQYICQSCKHDIWVYRHTAIFNDLKMSGVHAKSIVYAYVTGYMLRVAKRLIEIYEQRNKEVHHANDQYGLIIYKKKKHIEDEFKILMPNIKLIDPKLHIKSMLAYESGLEDGNKVQINQGLAENKINNTLLLN